MSHREVGGMAFVLSLLGSSDLGNIASRTVLWVQVVDLAKRGSH